MLLKNRKKITYIFKHKKAFLQVEKKLLKKNTFMGYFHDFDKIFMLLFMRSDVVSKIHRKYSLHHLHSTRKINNKRLVQMIIDYECSRITKKDKPLCAREFIYKNMNQSEIDLFEPLLIDLGL